MLGLLECPTIRYNIIYKSSLDLSDNKIADERVLPEIFEKLPNLAVLYLHGNDVCKKIEHYRKTLIIKLPKLKYLDDRPVFEDERRFCEVLVKYKGIWKRRNRG